MAKLRKKKIKKNKKTKKNQQLGSFYVRKKNESLGQKHTHKCYSTPHTSHRAHNSA